MPKPYSLLLRGYHRKMIPHVCEILDFDRANEFYRDFIAIEPTDNLRFDKYPKGQYREYKTSFTIEPEHIYEIKTIAELDEYPEKITQHEELNMLVRHWFFYVQPDYQIQYMSKKSIIPYVYRMLANE